MTKHSFYYINDLLKENFNDSKLYDSLQNIRDCFEDNLQLVWNESWAHSFEDYLKLIYKDSINDKCIAYLKQLVSDGRLYLAIYWD